MNLFVEIVQSLKMELRLSFSKIYSYLMTRNIMCDADISLFLDYHDVIIKLHQFIIKLHQLIFLLA